MLRYWNCTDQNISTSVLFNLETHYVLRYWGCTDQNFSTSVLFILIWIYFINHEHPNHFNLYCRISELSAVLCCVILCCLLSASAVLAAQALVTLRISAQNLTLFSTGNCWKGMRRCKYLETLGRLRGQSLTLSTQWWSQSVNIVRRETCDPRGGQRWCGA